MRKGTDARQVMDDRNNPNTDDRTARLYAADTIRMRDYAVDPAPFVKLFFPRHDPASVETGVSVHRPARMPAFPKAGGF